MVAWTKWRISCRRQLQSHFREWKCCINLIEMHCEGPNWQKVGIGSGNGLMPTRRQAIKWTGHWWPRSLTQLAFTGPRWAVLPLPPPLDKMAAVSQTIFSYAFSWMKNFAFWFKIHLSLFQMIPLKRTEPWFRKWLGAECATSHYLNQCWSDSLRFICDKMS